MPPPQWGGLDLGREIYDIGLRFRLTAKNAIAIYRAHIGHASNNASGVLLAHFKERARKFSFFLALGRPKTTHTRYAVTRPRAGLYHCTPPF